MSWRYLYTIVCLLGLGIMLSAASGRPAEAQTRSYRSGELLVQFKPGLRASALADANRNLGIRSLSKTKGSQINRLSLPSNLSVDDALSIYKNDPNVVFAEPNYIVSAQSTPNDPLFAQQWGLYNSGQTLGGYVGASGTDIDAVRAWDLDVGSREVIVAVVDTGCNRNHPDLAANIWTNTLEIQGNGLDDDGNGFVDDVRGWDFVDHDNEPQDTTGHGTHVAGIIAAHGNNGIGISGVAWNASIMPLRFLNAFDQGTVADAIEAIEYAVRQGADIINCSWGSTGYSTALRTTMANAENVLFVAAAGNYDTDSDVQGFYPASYDLPNIISVAAGDQMGSLAWFSNYGNQTVDVLAPGSRIQSLGFARQTLWQESFGDASLAGWTTGGIPDTWAVAGPPQAAYSTALAVTADDTYADSANTWIVMPTLDLSDSTGSSLTFQIIGQSETSADVLKIEISANGSDWSTRPVKLGASIKINGISGSIPYWTPARVDLGPWDGRSNVRVRFRFTSDADGSATGFFMDNITVRAVSSAEAYYLMNGTSMAAGFVSGVAALVRSQNVDLGALDLKTTILGSVDLDSGMESFLLTGGRVNAYNALMFINDLSLRADPADIDQIRLSWIAQTDLDNQLVVERRSETETAFQIVAQIDADGTSYTDRDLDPYTTYCYRVRAETTDGRSGFSNQTLVTTSDRAVSSGGGGGGGGCFVGSLIE